MIEKRDIMPDVLMFIGRFSHDYKEPRQQVIKCFTEGACYWFAFILKTRFAEYNPEIVIDLVANHFGCRINGAVYDITGEVTSGHKWQSWDEYDDDTHKKRITEYCIMF